MNVRCLFTELVPLYGHFLEGVLERGDLRSQFLVLLAGPREDVSLSVEKALKLLDLSLYERRRKRLLKILAVFVIEADHLTASNFPLAVSL